MIAGLPIVLLSGSYRSCSIASSFGARSTMMEPTTRRAPARLPRAISWIPVSGSSSSPVGVVGGVLGGSGWVSVGPGEQWSNSNANDGGEGPGDDGDVGSLTWLFTLSVAV